MSNEFKFSGLEVDQGVDLAIAAAAQEAHQDREAALIGPGLVPVRRNAADPAATIGIPGLVHAAGLRSPKRTEGPAGTKIKIIIDPFVLTLQFMVYISRCFKQFL